MTEGGRLHASRIASRNRARGSPSLREAHEEMRAEDGTSKLDGSTKRLRSVTAERMESSSYARSLIEASLDPLVTISADGKITDVNKATEEVTGAAREELIGSDFSDYFTEPDKAREGYRTVLRKGIVRDYALAIRSKSGAITDVIYNASLYRDESGEIQGIFAAARDVTERKKAEEKVRAASLYARSLIEASLDPLVTINREGKIGDVNQATEQVTGVSREKLIGSDFADYFTEPEKAREGYREVFSRGFVRDYPLAIHHVSGKVTDVLYHAVVYKNEAGEVQGVFAAARDVTARKKAEAKLRAASLYARTLIEASLDPLVTISSEGKITDVNKATEDVTGVPREQLIGSDFTEFFTDSDKARDGYERVLREGQVTDYPLTIRSKSGKVTEVLYNATLYSNEAGQVQGVFAAARDITERKRLDEKLNETLLELQRSNKELEQFAYVASHDLQEPLRMVASYVQLLAQRNKGRLDRDSDEFIAYAVDGANRMQRLINDLLAFSRVGTRGKPFEPTDFKFALNEALTNLSISIEASHATITHDPLPTLTADPSQVVQLLQNLVGNGVKFHAQDSPHIHVSAEKKQDEWVFGVHDNGIGIDPKYFSRIFNVFQRLHGMDDYPGTGIGLAICKKIVERHGGRIWVESTPGKGSVFYFTIPIRGERS